MKFALMIALITVTFQKTDRIAELSKQRTKTI